MDVSQIIITILIGGVSGWLASMIIKSNSTGVFMNIILGLVGAFIGAYLYKLLGWNIESKGLLGVLTMSTIGAILFLFVVRLIFRQRKR